MAYFADLTPYSYGESNRDRLNIGWLDAEHPFPTGEVEDLFRAALVHTLRFQVNPTRGAHACKLCRKSPIDHVDEQGGECLLGAAEIHVDGNDGSAFAAPSLIVHYVLEHGYAPPISFRRAVIDYATFYGLTFPATPERPPAR